jgi:ubiquinone/menaquinone biosynthesis C-methylase UbiE
MARFFATARWRESITRLERVTGKLQSDARVIDVGCGLNDYLVTLKKLRGIQGVGVDFSPEAAGYVRNTLQMPVHTGTLQQANFPDGMAIAMPFILLAPWLDEFRFAVARAV